MGLKLCEQQNRLDEGVTEADGPPAVAHIIKEINGRESYRSVADGLQCTRQAPSSVEQDSEKRR